MERSAAAPHRGGCGPGTASPYLFVYDLPRRYQVRGGHATNGDGSNFTFIGYPFGRLFGTWMYDVASLYVARALSYRCRTLHPALAELFFIPAYNTEMTQHPTSSCAERPRGPANHHMALNSDKASCMSGEEALARAAREGETEHGPGHE